MLLPYLEARLRRPVPLALLVVPGSTPVVAFGDFTCARMATLGLNPSRQEFLSPTGGMLEGSTRRFETLSSLGVGSLTDADAHVLDRVIDACRSYFDRGRNPYMRWFGQLERVLGHVGASYRDRTACHLDLVQWATDPVWKGLSDRVRSQLLVDDVPFLLDQLAKHRIDLLLLNGRRVIQELAAATGFEAEEIARLDWGDRHAGIYAGSLGKVRVVGWSPNLQSSFGVSNQLRDEIGVTVGRVATG